MERKTKGESRLSGFINGYKSSNIASIDSSIKYHFSEIIENIHSILSESSEDRELQTSLRKAIKILVESNFDYFDKIIQFGEAFKTIVLIIKGRETSLSLRSDKIKKILYHYFELAEKIEDKKINSLAISIGELF